MAEATVRFDYGAESVTVVLPVELPTGGTPLSGDVSGTYGDAFITGDLNLTGNLTITGRLTGIDTFHCAGNGFSIFYEDGGRPDLHGKVKGKWGEWGTGPRSADTTGWVAGDRLAIVPTAVGKFLPIEGLWTGDWATLIRPVVSPDVVLPPNPWRAVAVPEVVNLSQSIVFENLGRGFHFHGSAGVANVSDIKMLNCGTAGVLSNYPMHWHMCGENVRGSLLERVVVEGGQNHAFVPHGSHGVTLKGCVAYNTIDDAYWWDLPEDSPTGGAQHTANNSNDSMWDHCLALGVRSLQTDHSLSAFLLGAGSGNTIVDSVAACVQGGKDGSGFHWPAKANQNIGGNDWVFQRNLVHNNLNDGIFVWQNDPGFHLVEDFIAYRNRRTQIEHGAYTTNYHYRRILLMGGTEASFRFHSRNGGVLLEDVIADVPLVLWKHTFPSLEFTIVRRCQFPGVVYGAEVSGQDPQPSWMRYEDWGFTPTDFTLTSIHPDSLIEIVEAGVLTASWAGGWS